jgi:UDP-N-acetylmuramate--alanine ligase
MLDIFNKIKKVHFIGIGGSGMSGIAEVLLNLGYKVYGSDIKNSNVIKRLKALGAKIVLCHKKENVKNVDVVVYSSAIDENNPEILAAKKLNIPVIPRIEMLAEIARMKYTISVCGTHGKTTTTSMVGLLIDKCGYDPTIVVGGRFKNIGSSAKLGKGKFIIVEADESDGSFLKLSPYIVICTNIDNDHLDFYKNINNLKKAFLQHFNSIPFYGFNILFGDDKNILSLLNQIKRKFYTYGLDNNNDFIAKDINLNFNYSEFKAFYKDKFLGKIKLKVVGIHNVLNSLSVLACGTICGFEFKKIKLALEEFQGVERRLEFKGKIFINGCDVDIYDDYGHHPKEIFYTIKALKSKVGNKKIIVVFQPHRYTRTKILYKEFSKGFLKENKIFIMPIYPANEKPIKGISSKLIYDDLKQKGFDVEYFSYDKLLNSIEKDCVILTLGAGDVYKISEYLVEKYGK